MILRQDQPSLKDMISWNRTTGKQLWKTTFGDTLIFRQFHFIETTSDYVIAAAEDVKLVILYHGGTIFKSMKFDKPPSNVFYHGVS